MFGFLFEVGECKGVVFQPVGGEFDFHAVVLHVKFDVGELGKLATAVEDDGKS